MEAATQPASGLPALPGGTPTLDLGDTGLTPVSANFLQGINGKERAGFVAFAPSIIGNGWGSAYGGVSVNRAHRDRVIASTISSELLYSNSTFKTIVDSLTAHTVGPNGLTLSAQIDAKAAGITDAEARALNKEFERGFAAWCADPNECDLSGRHDFHTIAGQAFISYLISGEILGFVDVARAPGAKSLTKCCLADPRMISLESRSTPSYSVFNGIQFSKTGRFEGIWARRIPLGAIASVGELVFIRAKTPWGRQKIVHLFDSLSPGTVRGMSPLTNALGSIVDRDMLNQILIGSYSLQSAHALTLTSSIPAHMALQGMEIPNEPGAMANAIAEGIISLRGQWLGEGGERSPRIQSEPGQVVALPPGDKLELTQPAKISDDFDSFNRSLTLDAARAAGASGSDISGDYSKTSYSASRMETELPFRKALTRRREIVAPFYQAFYRAFVEEQIGGGSVKLPRGARPYWDCPGAYTAGKFLGIGRVEADRLKAAQADILMLSNHTTSLTTVLQAQGIDFDDHIAHVKYEREALLAAGLSPEYTTTSRRQIQEDEADEGTANASETKGNNQ